MTVASIWHTFFCPMWQTPPICYSKQDTTNAKNILQTPFNPALIPTSSAVKHRWFGLCVGDGTARHILSRLKYLSSCSHSWGYLSLFFALSFSLSDKCVPYLDSTSCITWLTKLRFIPSITSHPQCLNIRTFKLAPEQWKKQKQKHLPYFVFLPHIISYLKAKTLR